MMGIVAGVCCLIAFIAERSRQGRVAQAGRVVHGLEYRQGLGWSTVVARLPVRTPAMMKFGFSCKVKRQDQSQNSK